MCVCVCVFVWGGGARARVYLSVNYPFSIKSCLKTNLLLHHFNTHTYACA